MTTLASDIVDSLRPGRASWVAAAAGIAVSAGLLVIAIRGASVAGVAAALRATRPLPIAAGLGCGLSACAVMGLRWRVLLQTGTPIAVTDAIDQVTISNLASLVLPARFGDVARVVLVRTRWRVPGSLAAGALVFERACDVLILVSLASAIAMVVELPAAIRAGVLTVGVSAAGALLALWFLASHANRWTGPVLARLPRRLAAAAETRLPRLIDSLQVIRRPRHLLAGVALSALIWSLSGLMLVNFLSALRVPVPWYAGFVVLMFVNLGGVVPSSPGGIGVYHYLSILALSFWSVDRSAALSFAMVSHALGLVVTATAGFYGLARQGLSLRSLNPSHAASAATAVHPAVTRP